MQQNFSPEMLKQQTDMMNNMSDEQLKNMANQASSINPMMKNMDPSMMRQATQMLNGMSPQQQ